MMKFKRNEKILLYATVAIVAAFIAQKFLFPGMKTKTKSSGSLITIAEARLKEGIEIQKRKADILADFKEFKGYLKTENMSELDITTGFLKEVESIAQASRVSIINLTPNNQPIDDGGYRRYTADLRVEGVAEEVFDFLKRIQSTKSLIKIDKMSIASKDEQASMLKLDTTISIAIP
ncbi:MAG: hypothetical protein WC779_06415 [Candidatus Omnitrophota bacterium]|jgi:Tfp pilus assembly protein PilO